MRFLPFSLVTMMVLSCQLDWGHARPANDVSQDETIIRQQRSVDSDGLIQSKTEALKAAIKREVQRIRDLPTPVGLSDADAEAKKHQEIVAAYARIHKHRDALFNEAHKQKQDEVEREDEEPFEEDGVEEDEENEEEDEGGDLDSRIVGEAMEGGHENVDVAIEEQIAANDQLASELGLSIDSEAQSEGEAEEPEKESEAQSMPRDKREADLEEYEENPIERTKRDADESQLDAEEVDDAEDQVAMESDQVEVNPNGEEINHQEVAEPEVKEDSACECSDQVANESQQEEAEVDEADHEAEADDERDKLEEDEILLPRSKRESQDEELNIDNSLEEYNLHDSLQY